MYYAVALLDPLNEHAVSRYVDPFWHAHVLYTEEYIDFCNQIFGQYIQHKPLEDQDEIETAQIAILYQHTLNVYKKLFKVVDLEWWPEMSAPLIEVARLLVCRHQFIKCEHIRSQALFASLTSNVA